MDIIIYLIELLNSKKEIGINGLGTLYKKKSPGRYDAKTHTFLPPSYSLAFSSEVKEHNNLAIQINKKRNVSLGTANYFISQFVEEVHQTIQNTGEFEMPGIGKLVKNSAGEIELVPELNVDFGFDFFALPPVKNEIVAPVAVREIPSNEPETALEEVVEENIIEEENPGHQPYIETVTPETSDDDVALEETEEEIPTVEAIVPDFENTVTENEETLVVIEEEENQQTAEEEIIEEQAPETETVVEQVPKEEKEETGSDIAREVIEEEKTEQPTAISEEEIHPVYEEITEVKATEEYIPKVAPRHIETVTPETSSAEAEEKLEPVEVVPVAKTVNEQYGNGSFASTPTETYPEEPVQEERKGLGLWIKILIVLLCIVIVGAVVYFINPNIYQSLIQKNANQDRKAGLHLNANPELKSLEDSLSFADSIMNTAEKVGLSVNKAKDTLKFTVKAQPVNTTTYEIIGVAYKTQKEVDDYIAKMKKRGIVAKAVNQMPGRMTKISLATYNNRDSARKDLDRFKEELKNPGLYIYVNKNKE